MKTRERVLSGLVIAALALSMTGAAIGIVLRALDSPTPSAELRQPRERVLAVPVGTLVAETLSPVMTSYGRITSGRSLEVRSSVAGPLVSLASGFRDGGTINAGEVMFAIDPARLETAVALAESDLAEAEAELSRTRAALVLARLDAQAAQEQLDLRAETLARQQGLAERDVGRIADLEAAALAHAAATQTAIGRQQAVAAEEARIAQAEIAVERRRIALQEAQRALGETSVAAPFDGLISASTATLGRLVSAGERLGVLIDPGELEVSFRLTATQYSRLLDDQRRLRPLEVTLALQTWRLTYEFTAVLDRVGAETGEGQVGRVVHARLVNPDPTMVQPGDFVTIRIPEPPLSDVVQIPAAAATPDGRILVIGEGNRLEEVQATILRHPGDMLIVTDVPLGRDYVLARALQLGPGLRVEPVRPALSEEPAMPAVPAAPADTILLDDYRRAALIAFIEANESMRPETRERVLNELRQPEVPRATVERFEARMEEQ